MREAELWARLERHLGKGYAVVWAERLVMAGLGGRTVSEALASGTACRQIWLAAWEELELPPSER